MGSTTVNNTLIHPQVCVLLNKNMHFNGMFLSGNPLDYIVPVFMLQVILSVLISRAIHVTLRPLKQSKLVCNILAGLILGPSVLGRSKLYMEKMFAPKEMVVTATMSNMATTLFIFLICIKMDAAMLSRTAKETWRIGLSCMIIPFLFTVACTLSLDHFLPGIRGGKAFPIQFSIVSSLSYFIVIAHALDELNLLSSELGQLSISITMLNEIVSGFLVMVGVALGQKDKKDMLYAILSLCGLAAFVIFVIRPVLHWIIKRTPKGKPVHECYVIAILLWTLLLGVATDAVGASFSPAAMIMGFVIPDGPPLGATITEKCELFISEFFLPLFFVRIGYFTNLSAIQDWKELIAFGAVIAVGYLGRIVGSILVSLPFNMRKSTAILLSLILSLQGIVELLQGIRWKHQKLLDDQNFATLVMSIIILNAIITPTIEIYYKPEVKGFELPDSVTQRARSLEMTSSIGELRVITCVQEEDNVPSIISLLEALNPKEVSPICAYVIHLVALASQTVPTLAPYKNHKRMFSKPNGSDNIMRAFLNYAEHSRGPVQVQPFRMISPFKYMHQPICRLAEMIRTPLIIVPFFKSQDVHSTDGTLRIFNNNIQAFAKCTVGILVDRGLRTHFSLTSFSYNVAVIFLGGADDREALVFAARMSRHPSVAITLLRIHLRGNRTLEFEIERELDESLLRDFKAMNDSNACVVCHELVAHNSEEVMQALRFLANTYDLVVVGKRHGIAQFEEGLISWTQYPELGVIGDAIAAPDFYGGMMSALVLQHHSEENQSVCQGYSWKDRRERWLETKMGSIILCICTLMRKSKQVKSHQLYSTSALSLIDAPIVTSIPLWSILIKIICSLEGSPLHPSSLEVVLLSTIVQPQNLAPTQESESSGNEDFDDEKCFDKEQGEEKTTARESDNEEVIL
ncbi:cation/H(+) antiporter 15-like [Durio zibethinus]|uniref:Cation/H(+) antiporter 15-like n=1 Tax=Durio zibethinus TaxID=66656 RepID=A0A6P5YTM7_DURZI|nr:cation/H(+) antiporter 15-like [Durio zibethinus]